MIGVIIGDIAGSVYEWDNIKSKDFELFSHKNCRVTDDSIMTLAIAEAFNNCNRDFSDLGDCTISSMKRMGALYPDCGFGGRFKLWLKEENSQPYDSYGNGSAMRVSPVAYVAKNLNEVIKLSNIITEVTHNHPEGLKGAECVAVCVWMALNKKSKKEIKKHVEKNYYSLDFTIDEIRNDYTFDVSCQGSVPQSIVAFLEGKNLEDVIKTAISLGGDSDTIAAIVGSIAGAFYGVNENLKNKAMSYLDENLLNIYNSFSTKFLSAKK